MQTDVLININTVQKIEGGETNNVELTTTGKYTDKNGKYYISYEESPATGLEGSTTVLKVENEKVTLMRNGAYATRLYIEKGKRHLCHYQTGFGEMMVGISTKSISSNLSKSGGELFFSYTIDINSGLDSQNEVYIKVRKAENQECQI